jgi:hypothetical protein
VAVGAGPPARRVRDSPIRHEQRLLTCTVADDHPDYYVPDPQTLVTSTDPVSFAVGTGSEILSSVLHSCESTIYELIIVTCFCEFLLLLECNSLIFELIIGVGFDFQLL